MAKEREKVFVDLGSAVVRAQELLIVLTFSHQTRKANAKEKAKEKIKEKAKRKPRAKVKEKKRKVATVPAKEVVPAKTIGTWDGERIHQTIAIKVLKEKVKEKEDVGEKVKVKARVKAKRGFANGLNLRSARPSAGIGTRILAHMATTASLTTRQTVKTGRMDGANGIKNVVLGTSRV